MLKGSEVAPFTVTVSVVAPGETSVGICTASSAGVTQSTKAGLPPTVTVRLPAKPDPKFAPYTAARTPGQSSVPNEAALSTALTAGLWANTTREKLSRAKTRSIEINMYPDFSFWGFGLANSIHF